MEGVASDEDGASNAEGERNDDRRELIWSVSSEWSSLCFKVFYAALLASVWQAVAIGLQRRTGQGFVATAYEIGVGLSALGVASALATLMIVETWRLKEVARTVFSEMLKARVYNRIHDKGYVAGRSEGRSEGAEFVQQQLAEWNRRRMEHEARGDSFTEPPTAPEMPPDD